MDVLGDLLCTTLKADGGMADKEYTLVDSNSSNDGVSI